MRCFKGKQKAFTSFWQGWSVMVVKVLLEQMGWYSLLRVCAAGPCTCTMRLDEPKSGCTAPWTIKHCFSKRLAGTGSLFLRPCAGIRHLFGDAGDGLPQGRAVPVLGRRHAGCRSVWRRGWEGLPGPAQSLSVSANMSDFRSGIQWGLLTALLGCTTVL